MLVADIRDDKSEILHYDNPDFPVFCRFNQIPGGVVLSDTSPHWHEDIEFIYVTKGSIIQYINDKKIVLHKGEGVFINSRQIHVVENNNEDCHLYCLIMRPTILCASEYLERTYVNPILDNNRLAFVLLNESEDWNRRVLSEIKSIVKISIDSGNCLLMLQHIFKLWDELYKEVKIPENTDKSENNNLSIMKKMLTYIHSHYMEEISLKDLCHEGSIGKTKCAELFEIYVHITPIEYLICYRLERASILLRDTDMSIVDIAFNTGFSGASYFTEAFKKRIGMTPIKYRKLKRFGNIENEK